MITWCNLSYLKITSDIEPCTAVRKVMPSDIEEEVEDKKNYPYLNKRRILFTIEYYDKQYAIVIEKGFKWDGSTCPGLHHIPSLLNPSMVHDKLCNDHSLIDFDRKLSSIIFRELGIASKVNRAFMYIAYHCVDNFQKVFGKDLQGRGWKEEK